MTETHRNLFASSGAGPAPTLLPDDPATADLAGRGREQFLQTVAAHPDSTLCWALLAEAALAVGSLEADLGAYAYARTGYHRGLDGLRRAGWKGSGPVPWQHVPNQGFLRALFALGRAAAAIGEDDEATRCRTFLDDCDPNAARALS